ncbi:hypothetical protein F53441_3527 [Fusarium austroafricanum]|uniref:SET domain-containing protein n=1 Tax=Fusarium austroafricanum TaxID=2364996 RepID=A0A8H4P2P0_9HYPO|nr:hypothetical protein F53441_3527 [Fusarium austroafricanum]
MLINRFAGDVEVRSTGTTRGVGLFALRDLPRRQNSAGISRRQNIADSFPILQGIPRVLQLQPQDLPARLLEQFRADYAFSEPAGRKALIYHNASKINHACPLCANATWNVDPQNPWMIEVRVNRDVYQGEEIFIHYGKPVLFGCAVCQAPLFRNNVTARVKNWTRKVRNDSKEKVKHWTSNVSHDSKEKVIHWASKVREEFRKVFKKDNFTEDRGR